MGLIGGGLVSLRFTPRRPILFVAGIGAAIAISPLSLAMLWPLPVVCLASFGLGITMEIMMVQWTVILARRIPPGKLARVSAYDALGSVMAMPVGALVAGPIAAAIGVSAAQYAAAVLIVIVSMLALIPRDVRRTRPGQLELRQRGPADGSLAGTDLAERELAERELAERELAERELAERELAERELAGQAASSAAPVNVAHIAA